jgi:hypothetical protein
VSFFLSSQATLILQRMVAPIEKLPDSVRREERRRRPF